MTEPLLRRRRAARVPVIQAIGRGTALLAAGICFTAGSAGCSGSSSDTAATPPVSSATPSGSSGTPGSVAGQAVWPTSTSSPASPSQGGSAAPTVAIPVSAGPGGPELYPQLGTVSAAEAAPVTCTAYGRMPGTRNVAVLWDYTPRGWVEDKYLHGAGAAPTADGCYGNIAHPSLDDVWSHRPDPRTGPFPIRTLGGHGTGLYTTPDADRVSKGTLPEGALVRLTCARSGVTISGPDGPTDDWDRVVDLDVYGWVSDADILTIQGYYPPPAKPGPADQLVPCWQ